MLSLFVAYLVGLLANRNVLAHDALTWQDVCTCMSRRIPDYNLLYCYFNIITYTLCGNTVVD